LKGETRPKQTPNGERDDLAEPVTDSPCSRRFGTQNFDLITHDYLLVPGALLFLAPRYVSWQRLSELDCNLSVYTKPGIFADPSWIGIFSGKNLAAVDHTIFPLARSVCDGWQKPVADAPG
jgi:hypothetical protein